MKHLLIQFCVVLLAFIVYFIVSNNIPKIKRIIAGKKGEKIAKTIIKEALDKDDILLSNVVIKYEGKKCECDDVVINKNGVFVIEVKNYKGHLTGGVKDKMWKKTSFGKNGVNRTVFVKNPFKQVNRNVYILSNYLSNKGHGTLIKGYVIVLNNNQIVGNNLLKSSEDVSREIHNLNNTKKSNYLTKSKQIDICRLLK